MVSEWNEAIFGRIAKLRRFFGRNKRNTKWAMKKTFFIPFCFARWCYGSFFSVGKCTIENTIRLVVIFIEEIYFHSCQLWILVCLLNQCCNSLATLDCDPRQVQHKLLHCFATAVMLLIFCCFFQGWNISQSVWHGSTLK